MPDADRRRARISRAAARRSCGATRSGETQVRRKRQREIQEARGILIPFKREREYGKDGKDRNKRKVFRQDGQGFSGSGCKGLIFHSFLFILINPVQVFPFVAVFSVFSVFSSCLFISLKWDYKLQ